MASATNAKDFMPGYCRASLGDARSFADAGQRGSRAET